MEGTQHHFQIPGTNDMKNQESQESSDITRNEDTLEQEPFLKNEVEDTPKSPPTMLHENENITEARRNDENIVKKEPVLGIKVEGTSTSESPPTTRQDVGNITEARRSGNSDASYPADMDESDLSEKFEDAPSSPTIIKQKNSEVSRDVQNKNLDEENSAENRSGVCIDSSKQYNKGNKQELTDVFDDTVESLQRIVPPTDEQDKELCIELYNLLGTQGLILTQDVMTATITRETGKSVETLLKNLTDQDKSKLKEVLHEESHRIIDSKAEHGMSFHVLYGLHWVFLDEERSPKSGWSNPVRETDIGISDDVERLNRIQTIVCGISNPVTVSVESYIRMLDIMIEALTRLDPGAEFREDYKLLSYKLKSIKNLNLTQTMLKTITDLIFKNSSF